MLLNRRHTECLFFLTALLTTAFSLHAQDSTKENRLDTFLLKQKGVLGTLAQTLMAGEESGKNDLQRSDVPFQPYRNRVIRNITIEPLEFGILVGDTTKRFNNGLTHLANAVHSTTRNFVLRNHLFFHEGDRLSPFLLGNNERYLRDLPFLQEAHIQVDPVAGSKDSVDVVVYTKDVLSIGGSMAIPNSESGRIELREDNFMGWGDRLEVQTLFDKTRSKNFGFGADYTKRNILGTFIDASGGYLNFNPAFSSQRSEESLGYLQFVKPLVNPYMRWTYAASAEVHATSNLFNSDSVYHNAIKYKYRIYDAWAGWNLSAKNIGASNEFERLRFLISARVLDQKFLSKPEQYIDHYHYSYANMKALLGAISVFKLNYYKTGYIYGFGRKEDIPEGLEASFTTGFTNKEGRKRPYMALSFEQYYLTKKERYLDYSLSLGTSVYKQKMEDVNLLATVDYFGRLQRLGTRWKQRTFLNASFARQFNPLLDEPLFVESTYGLPEFKNNLVGGNMRATVKGESVFFSPWSLFFFKFAPFVFSSATLFQYPYEKDYNATKLYTAIGGGIRTRNESLIFGTIELRGSWFPRKDFFNNNFLIQLSTNLRFKFNQQFIRRPEFVQMN